MKRLILDKITSSQRRSMELLLQLCGEKDPIRLSIPLAVAGIPLADERFFVLYENGQLLSMIHLFYPDHTVGELIGFTHPDVRGKHYFNRLLSLAVDYAEEIGLEQVYVISDGNSPDATKALDALGLDVEYSEYMLGKRLDIPSTELPLPIHESGTFPDVPSAPQRISDQTGLSVTETTSAPLSATLFSRIFQSDIAQCEAYIEDISTDDRIHSYVLSLNGTHIGQTQLTFMGDMAYLSGFGILPEYRKQGYGLQFLRRLETLLISQSITQLTLQVSSYNKTALSLYRKDGFEVLECLNYHPLFEEE